MDYNLDTHHLERSIDYLEYSSDKKKKPVKLFNRYYTYIFSNACISLQTSRLQYNKNMLYRYYYYLKFQ